MKTKYWYEYFIGECPVCGRDQSYKIKRTTKKPKKKEDRYILLPSNQTYDNCVR